MNRFCCEIIPWQKGPPSGSYLWWLCAHWKWIFFFFFSFFCSKSTEDKENRITCNELSPAGGKGVSDQLKLDLNGHISCGWTLLILRTRHNLWSFCLLQRLFSMVTNQFPVFACSQSSCHVILKVAQQKYKGLPAVVVLILTISNSHTHTKTRTHHIIKCSQFDFSPLKIPSHTCHWSQILSEK